MLALRHHHRGRGLPHQAREARARPLPHRTKGLDVSALDTVVGGVAVLEHVGGRTHRGEAKHVGVALEGVQRATDLDAWAVGMQHDFNEAFALLEERLKAGAIANEVLDGCGGFLPLLLGLCAGDGFGFVGGDDEQRVRRCLPQRLIPQVQ